MFGDNQDNSSLLLSCKMDLDPYDCLEGGKPQSYKWINREWLLTQLSGVKKNRTIVLPQWWILLCTNSYICGNSGGIYTLFIQNNTVLTQFHFAIHCQEDVTGLQISVYDSVFVNEIKALTHLPTDVADLFLIERLFQVHHDAVHSSRPTILDKHLKEKKKIYRKLQVLSFPYF